MMLPVNLALQSMTVNIKAQLFCVVAAWERMCYYEYMNTWHGWHLG